MSRSYSVGTHFQQELTSQAAKIVGSVDVLGNPLGLVNDVTTGISGLVTEGNIGLLLKNVTHGASNSLAKVDNFIMLSYYIQNGLNYIRHESYMLLHRWLALYLMALEKSQWMKTMRNQEN